ncbi:MAG: hypothetical protein LBD97_05715 [Bifidobacteriaceae bacterium]|jgi:type II secretory pathway pseudopilin PulG|nr:hypothetical protein [Bifidobacteriaceae bacterium]
MRDYLKRNRRRAHDAGITMVAVLAAFTVLIVVVLGSLAYLSASTKYSRYEQDNDLALAAAQSGLNDLLSRLRSNSEYLTSTEVINTKDEITGYCKNPAAGGPASEGDIYSADCGWASNMEARTLEYGSANGGKYQAFHYVVEDYDPIPMTAVVVSTGFSGTTVRSIRARISQEGTPMYLYMSDYEVVDPTDYTTYPPDNGDTSLACGFGFPSEATRNELGYRWEINANKKPERFWVDRSGFMQTCGEPSFESWDVLDGPVHSNDTITSRGAQFIGGFSTGDPNCNPDPLDDNTWDQCVNGSVSNWNGLVPEGGVTKPIPQVPSKDDPDVKAEVNSAGCEYVGPTRIIFKETVMQVWSQDSNKPGDCGSASELKSSDGKEVNIPFGSLIAVRNLEDSDKAKRVTSGSLGDLPLGQYKPEYDSKPTAASIQYEIEVAMDEDRTNKLDASGNLWIEGVATGTVTVYADASIIITGDLLTDRDSSDMDEENLLGLMAGGSVELYHPIVRTYKSVVNPAGGFMWSIGLAPQLSADWKHTEYQDPPNYDVLRIEAAMVAGSGSFLLQNWKSGDPLGELQVFGSIAQNFRGVVAQKDDTTSAILHGYKKKYTYNTSLIKKQPLLFAPIGNGGWSILWQEKVDPSEAVKEAAKNP